MLVIAYSNPPADRWPSLTPCPGSACPSGIEARRDSRRWPWRAAITERRSSSFASTCWPIPRPERGLSSAFFAGIPTLRFSQPCRRTGNGGDFRGSVDQQVAVLLDAVKGPVLPSSTWRSRRWNKTGVRWNRSRGELPRWRRITISSGLRSCVRSSVALSGPGRTSTRSRRLSGVRATT